MSAAPLAARWMQRALELAARGRVSTHPNPRVGCVIVKDGRIVGEGWHRRAGEPHAEVLALAQAGAAARGATVFVTLEPCSHHGRTPPCVDALIAAGVDHVVAAMIDPNPQVAGRGMQRLRDAGIDAEQGLCEAAASALNRGFVSRVTRGRPWLTLKLAASLDGRTAMASGESRWITGEAARAEVHRLRAEAGAVLTSSATVLTDDPELTVRLPGDWRQPDRVVLDTLGRAPVDARVWAPGVRRFIVTGPAVAPQWIAALQHAGVEWLEIERSASEGIDLAAALSALGRSEINEVLVECGPRLGGALLRGGLVDELRVYLAPLLLGGNARPLLSLPGLERLSQAPRLRLLSATPVGDDLRLLLRPQESVSNARTI